MTSHLRARSSAPPSRRSHTFVATSASSVEGFTLIELVMVIIIVGIMFTLALQGSNSFTIWKEDAALRKLSETIRYLHHQATTEQAYYRLEFNFPENSYRVGVLRRETSQTEDIDNLVLDAGTLSLELSAFLNPSHGNTYTFIPPPSHPSLYEPSVFPPEMRIEMVQNMSGEHAAASTERVGITFSPRGFSEFAVIHILYNTGLQRTILVNPFSGLTTVQQGWKDYEWAYGKRRARA